MKEPPDAGFTGVVPPPPMGGALKPGSVLLQLHPVLKFVFHESVAPVPCTADAAERVTVGGAVTVRVAETVVAGLLQARVYVYEPADAGVTAIEPLPVFVPVNASAGVVSLLLAAHPWAPLVFHASVAAVPCSAAAGVTLMVGGG